jgi:hypothetical protein
MTVGASEYQPGGGLAVIAWEVFGTVRMRTEDDPVGVAPPGAPGYVETPPHEPGFAAGLVALPLPFAAGGPGGFGAAAAGGFGVAHKSAFGAAAAPGAWGGFRGFGQMTDGICAGGKPLPAELNGIAASLSEENAANVQVRMVPTLQVFAFEQLKSRGARSHVGNVSGSVELHFVKHRVRVTGYAVAVTRIGGSAGWELDCSDDGSNGTTVDQGHDESQTGEVHTFELSSPVECSRFRFRWPREEDSHVAVLPGFDVFGCVLD